MAGGCGRLPQGGEVLIGEGPSVEIAEAGSYRYEAFNRIAQNGFEIECASSSLFEAIVSSSPEIVGITRDPLETTFNVTARVQGGGDYLYALNNIEGPYQEQNQFTDLPPGDYMLYVRDRNGCGTDQYSFKLAFPPPGFPAYFSPNNDGINDYWQYKPPNTNALDLVRIEVFDRYGKILDSFSPFGPGWDGQYEGMLMPAEGYWYKATASDGRVYRGNFSLVR